MYHLITAKIKRRTYYCTTMVNPDYVMRRLLLNLKGNRQKQTEFQQDFNNGGVPTISIHSSYTDKAGAVEAMMSLIEQDKHAYNTRYNPLIVKNTRHDYISGKLTAQQVHEIRSLIGTGVSLRVLADDYNVSHVTILRVMRGESYGWLA